MRNKGLNTLEIEYQDACANNTISIDQDYFHALQEHIEHEKNVGYLSIIHHTLLLISIMTIFPAIIALTPWATVFGGLFSILTTIGNYYAEHYFKQSLHYEVSSLHSHHFFKPLAELQNQSTLVGSVERSC